MITCIQTSSVFSASMGQNHDNVHPDLIRCSPVHPWAKTMKTSTQTSSDPQSMHGLANHENVHIDLILSFPDHPWVNRHVIPPRPHPFSRASMGQNQDRPSRPHRSPVQNPFPVRTCIDREHPWANYDNVHADLVLSSEHPFANRDIGHPDMRSPSRSL